MRLGNRTIGVNLAVSNYGRCGFLTAPFCINISNNAKDENISVRSRAIHCATTNESFLKLTLMVRLGNRTYHPENRTNPVNWVLALNNHFSSSREIACSKRIEIDAACDRFTHPISSIPKSSMFS